MGTVLPADPVVGAGRRHGIDFVGGEVLRQACGIPPWLALSDKGYKPHRPPLPSDLADTSAIARLRHYVVHRVRNRPEHIAARKP